MIEMRGVHGCITHCFAITKSKVYSLPISCSSCMSDAPLMGTVPSQEIPDILVVRIFCHSHHS